MRGVARGRLLAHGGRIWIQRARKLVAKLNYLLLGALDPLLDRADWSSGDLDHVLREVNELSKQLLRGLDFARIVVSKEHVHLHLHILLLAVRDLLKEPTNETGRSYF